MRKFPILISQTKQRKYFSSCFQHAAVISLLSSGCLLTAILADDSSKASGGSQTIEVRGQIRDADSGQLIPARVHVQEQNGDWHLLESVGGTAVHYDRHRPNMPASRETHTTLSAHPFAVDLKPGSYTFRVERGKEYVPVVKRIEVGTAPVTIDIRLQRWINMAERGWYSGDTHVHRTVAELPNVMLAEDLNVALPLTYWVTHADTPPGRGDRTTTENAREGLLVVDPTHVIYSTNTEYEIFSVGPNRHTLGAVFVLNHKTPLALGTPPVAPIARIARQQGALLDLDKHSWPWSLMIVPVMNVDLFELANNHVWQTEFGFRNWTVDTIPAFMNIERTADGGVTEWGWIDFGCKSYYALLNSGFRLRVSAGTASGVHPVQLGFGRVYVWLPDGFSYEAWVEGLNSGRSFVSTGPMLEATFNGRPPGHQFRHDSASPFEMRVQVRASSKRPLDRIELVTSGTVTHTLHPQNTKTAAGGYESLVDQRLEIDSSSWVAVRCWEQHPAGRVRFAHTNPVFVDVVGKPLSPKRAEVAYFVERMQDEIQRNRALLTPSALDEYREALAIYQQLLARAK